jgi:hypothetical protein
MHDVVAEALSHGVSLIDVIDIHREHRVLASRGVAADKAHLGCRVARRSETGDPAEVECLLEAEEFDLELMASGRVGDVQVRNDPLDHHEPIVVGGYGSRLSVRPLTTLQTEGANRQPRCHETRRLSVVRIAAAFGRKKRT